MSDNNSMLKSTLTQIALAQTTYGGTHKARTLG